MNITRMAIEKKSVSIVALVVLLFAGINAYRVMPRAEDPGFIIRAAMVVTHFPGASAARVEDLVTDKIEEVVQQIPELDFVTSTSKPGVSIIVVNIQERYKEMRPIWDNLRRKVDDVSGDLPEGVVGPFVNDEFGDVFGTILMVTGDGYTWAELEDVADAVRKEILYLDEVGKVEIQGVQEERIYIEYNNARLAELGISPSQLSTIIANRNIVIPGGSINTQEDRERINLEPTGNFESLEDLKRTVIELPGQRNLLYLGDLANIERATIDPPNAITRYSGQPALALAINMREGGNLIRLGEQVKELVTRLRQQYPIGLELDFVAFQAKFVEKRVKDFSSNLLQAVFIVMLVMLVTLGIRTGLVVAGLIPVVMIVSLLIMSGFDIGLDQMSLASLIISLGLLVDNAIVMSESIMVLIAAGRKPVAAALQSTSELRIPLLTSSLTTAAAFLPIYLAESTTGEYTAPLFKVVTIALLTSWVLSLTLTPLCCVYLLKVKPKATAEKFQGRFYRGYRRILITLLRRRALTLLATVGLLALAVLGLRFVPAIFFPPNDKPIFTVEVKLPVGTPIERTSRVVQEIEDYMRRHVLVADPNEDGVLDWVTFIGEGAPRFILSYNPEPAAPEYAFLMVNASRYEAIDPLMRQLHDHIAGNYPDVELTIDYLPLGAPVEAPVEIRVSGADTDRLFDIADEVKARMMTTKGLVAMDDDWGPRSKKLLIEINQARARRAGLTSRDVAISLQTVLSGFTTTEYRENDKVIPVILRSNAADRKDLGKLESHNIYVQSTGQSVPLKQVADAHVVWEAAKIHRRDRKQTITVQAWLDESRTAIAVAMELDAWLREHSADWGIGYQYELGGEMESSAEANESIAAKLPFAAMLIVLLLVAQFNSIRKPLIILLTIPLGLIGVTFGLLVARSYFGFMTLLGVISLAGIVINNAIVLLERIKLEIEENGLEPATAIVAASQQRLRPILLTTSTTVGGLLPLWLGGGPMWEPMAIAIIFGLLFATLLTLGLVPVLYSVFFRVHVGGLSHS